MKHGRYTPSIRGVCECWTMVGTEQVAALVASLVAAKGTGEFHLARLGKSDSLEQTLVGLVLGHGMLRI